MFRRAMKEEDAPKSAIEQLPEEILLYSFGFLSPKDRAKSAAPTCRLFRRLTSDQVFLAKNEEAKIEAGLNRVTHRKKQIEALEKNITELKSKITVYQSLMLTINDLHIIVLGTGIKAYHLLCLTDENNSSNHYQSYLGMRTLKEKERKLHFYNDMAKPFGKKIQPNALLFCLSEHKPVDDQLAYLKANMYAYPESPVFVVTNDPYLASDYPSIDFTKDETMQAFYNRLCEVAQSQISIWSEQLERQIILLKEIQLPEEKEKPSSRCTIS